MYLVLNSQEKNSTGIQYTHCGQEKVYEFSDGINVKVSDIFLEFKKNS